jgi:two-component system chemotaxis sensor kinase CheA
VTDHAHDDLDDYVAECDEHLSAARRTLLDLEATRNVASADREQVDALFRAFHTVKGLSGMVGARAAEEVAHGLEAYLGAVRKGQVTLTERGVDVLLEGIALVETAVNAVHGGQSAPDTSAVAAQIAALLPVHPTTPNEPPASTIDSPQAGVLPPDRKAKLAAGLARGERAWQITFTPSPALAQRGINVNGVRERLQAGGTILHAEPAPIPGGGIQFTFLVIGPADFDFSAFVDDGIAVTPYEPPTASVTPLTSRQAGASLAQANLVRVDLSRLDDLMRGVGELVLSRSRLESNLARVSRYLPPGDRRELEETTQLIERQLRGLREGLMRVRMVPVRELFSRMRLVVRDLTRESDKQVDLVVMGEETEIDKFLGERMSDPLLHLVRNAVSHGLEPAAKRVASGKPARGRLTLRASAPGGTIVLEVEDDGRGIDVDAVFARARATGLIAADAPADPAAVLDLICTPGFSTRAEADRTSGRGVGMDVVRRMVEGIGGSLALHTRPGLGTRITARLPLTLVVADVLTLAVGDQLYAIPQTAVREVLPVEPGSTTILPTSELIRYRGGVLPLLRLGELFKAARPPGAFVALVVGEGAAMLALAADRAVGLREVVVRALADPLVQVPGISGATELGDGRPILILDPAGLVRQGRLRNTTAAARS